MDEKYRVVEAIFVVNWVGRPLKQLLFRKRYLAAKKRLRSLRLTQLALDPPSAVDGSHETFLGYYPDGQPVVSIGGQVNPEC